MKFEVNLNRLNELRLKKCPCALIEDEDTLCPCREFTLTGKCRCGTFKEIKE